MRDGASLLQAKDFTQDTATKAVAAVGGALTATLHQWVCNTSRTGAIACQVFDGVSVYLKVLVAMMVMDLITGVMASRAEGKRIDSRRLGIGTQRKIVMLLVIAASVLIDSVFHAHGIPTGHLLYSGTASWFIAVEALSLYENSSRIGVPMPKFLKQALEFLLQRANQTGESVIQVKAVETPPETREPS